MKVLLAVFISAVSIAAQGPSSRSVQPGTISGRVLTHEGVPAAGIRVSALEVGNPLFPDSQALASIAQTDRGGRYRLEDIPPGRYLITAGMLDSPTYFPGADAAYAANILTVAPASKLAGVNFSLAIAAGLRFSGKIIRQDNAGKTITGPITAGAPAGQAMQTMQIRLQAPNLPMQTAVVGADGLFDFPQVRPGTYQINITPLQGRTPQLSVTLLDRDITNFELGVPAMVQVTGTTTVEEGGPVPRFPIVFSNANDALALIAGQTSGVQQTVQAQANPRFTVQLPVGANRLTIGSVPSGFTIKKIVAGGVDLIANPLIVTPAGASEIQVILSAASVPWVRVSGRVIGRSVFTVNSININSPTSSSPPQVVFYLDGTFEIPKALPGSYRIGGGLTAATELVVPSGVAEVKGMVIDAGPAAESESASTMPIVGPSSAIRVSGRIVGRAKAQPGVQVRIEDAATGQFRTAPIYVDGSFEFQGAQPGTYVAEVLPRIAGAEPATFTVDVRNIGDIRLLVPDTRDVAGKVAIEGAGELPRALVFVAASARVSADVRPNGSFTVALPDGFSVSLAPDSLPEGYAVSAFKYGAADLLATPLRLSGSETELRLALKTARGAASVSGRISGDTAVLGESRIWLTETSGRQTTLETTLGANGTFSFPNVGEGRYTVSLVTSGMPANAVSAPVIVTAGRNITDVNLSAPRLVRGRVTIDGAALTRRFGLRLDGGPETATIVIDPQPDGSFSVLLPTGERTIGAATGLPAGREIRAISYGTADLLKNPLRVPAAGVVEALTIQLK